MEETSQAVKEVAKATGQAIKTVDRLGQFFAKVMAEPIDSTCGMIADTLKFKRWERQIKLVEKAERLIDEKKISDKCVPISPKLALPIFQNASIEEDDFLHDLYAKLLVTAIDPSLQTRRTAFCEIIRQLEPLDVKIIQKIYKIYKDEEKRFSDLFSKQKFFRTIRPPTSVSISKSQILDSLSVNESTYWESIDNLCRLGLADSYFEEGSIDFETDEDSLSENVVTSHGGYNSLCITALGIAFVKICNY
jgi:Abortive infection alpha